VSDDTVKALIGMAIQAPSAGNLQNWEFIIVKDPGLKGQLADAAMGQSVIKDAPVVIVVCANQDLIRPRYGARGAELYSIQNTAAAIENLMLAAWDKGLATCWIGAFSETDVSRILAITRGVRPLAIITLGHPAEKGKKPARRDVKEVMHFEAYGKRV
jgi:nitroreductase